jgi:hypothetical protein
MRRGVVLVPLAAAVLFLTACTGRAPARSQPPPSSSTAQAGPAQAAASDGCAGQPPVTPLPAWAQTGFSPPDQAVPHVLGQSGDIVAILWADHDALEAPSSPDRSNKILWVSRIPLTTADPLVITATLAGSTRTATVSVPGGPGPSIINLPAAGCWTLHLAWSGHTDQLQLRYAV